MPTPGTYQHMGLTYSIHKQADPPGYPYFAAVRRGKYTKYADAISVADAHFQARRWCHHLSLSKNS